MSKKITFPNDWEERFNTALVLETERAIKQRDKFLETGVVTASHGGSHDTCFGPIVRKFMAELCEEKAVPALDLIRGMFVRDSHTHLCQVWEKFKEMDYHITYLSEGMRERVKKMVATDPVEVDVTELVTCLSILGAAASVIKSFAVTTVAPPS